MATAAASELGKLTIRETIDPELKEKWEMEQDLLKERLILENTEDWQRKLVGGAQPDGLKYIAGMDLSFIKNDKVNACLGLVILTYPQLEVAYKDCHMIEVTEPYVSGFLAFREAPHMIDAYNKLVKKHPDLKPQVLMVDGNGILHHRGFGLGCHLGVKLDIPVVGVAKKLLQVDGLVKGPEHKQKIDHLRSAGDSFPLIGDSKGTLGEALRSTADSTNPVYVSVGHRISLEVAVKLVRQCSLKRVPEPTRQADLLSREFLRNRQQASTSLQ